ncbi:hypothetical protein Hanom_Chr00s126940g01813831 [Helianthus anomalus]
MKSLTVAPYWFTVGACKTSGHRKLRCHRNLRWRSGTYGCRKTIKLSEEPNTIKIHASAYCKSIFLNDEFCRIRRCTWKL